MKFAACHLFSPLLSSSPLFLNPIPYFPLILLPPGILPIRKIPTLSEKHIQESINIISSGSKDSHLILDFINIIVWVMGIMWPTLILNSWSSCFYQPAKI